MYPTKKIIFKEVIDAKIAAPNPARIKVFLMKSSFIVVDKSKLIMIKIRDDTEGIKIPQDEKI